MRRFVRSIARLLAVSLLLGVLVISEAPPAGATACTADSLAVWGAGNCTVSAFGNGVLQESVSYTVPGGGTVEGWVCRPNTIGVDYPVLVFNHAANSPLTLEETNCELYPVQGYVVLVSKFLPQGEPVDPGDFCVGEVDDVVTMIDMARDLPFVDDDNIAMRGISLGGCVTLRIHQAGLAGLRAAAAINPPTDMAAVYTNSATKYTSNLCSSFPFLVNCAGWKRLRDGIATATGGPPSPLTQAEYEARSPLHFLADTAASTVPLVIVQGQADPFIPIAQTCAFAKALNDLPNPAWNFTPVRFANAFLNFTPQILAPSGCSGMGSWQNGNPVTAGYPDDHYLFVFDNFDHDSPPAEFTEAVIRADNFMRVRLP
jgi:pimeloyl-ACP methyl ester carboxylesterase